MSGSTWRQTVAVTLLNLRNLPQRLDSSLVAVIGIAGVVAVLVALLSISEGFRATVAQKGRDDVVIVIRGGSGDELSSGLGKDQVQVVTDAPGIQRDDAGALASPELYTILDLPTRKEGAAGPPSNVPFRGITANAPKIRREFRIVEGRMLTPGKDEVIVGRAAAGQFYGLEVGKQITSGSRRWEVVGIFTDDGGVSESEVWADLIVLQGAYRRGTTVQSVRAKLDNPLSLGTLKRSLAADPRVNVTVRTEQEFLAEQSRILVGIISVLGTAIALLMGAGAVFAAVNTMYSAVSARTREIATLRAIGFGGTPVLISVLIEALALGLLGGVLGGAAAYFAFNGYQASTLNFATFSQVSFAFRVTPGLLITGVIYALLLGLAGGLLPGWRAARLPVTEGLRALGVLLATGLALWSAPLVTGGGRAMAADESLPSIEAAAEFAAYTLDANALERLAVDTAPIARGTAAERYTHALVQWRRVQVASTLGGLDGEAGAASGKPRREAALAVARKAGKACLEAADRAVDAAAVKIEADALGAACAVWAARAEALRAPSALLSRRRWSKDGQALAPANPRLQLAEAWSDLLLPTALAADRTRGCNAVRALAPKFAGLTATTVGGPRWGEVDVWFEAGRCAAEQGDLLAARQAYEQVLLLVPEHVLAGQALKGLTGQVR